MAALFLQPAVGAWSDKCVSTLGRRRPFIIFFHTCACMGFTGLVFVDQIPGLSASDELNPVFLALVFVAFSLTVIFITKHNATCIHSATPFLS
jgi:Na+/melibiose symporter-like transporter